MRQSAGKSSANAQSARGRAALLNQAATVAPTLARSISVARASSTLLLKTASCTRARLEVRACQWPKYNGLGSYRATHKRTGQAAARQSSGAGVAEVRNARRARRCPKRRARTDAENNLHNAQAG